MDFSEFAGRILSGGLPAVLDNPNAQTAGSSTLSDTRVEQRAPSGTLQDRDTFANQMMAANGVRYAAFGVAVLVCGLALLAVLRK